MWYRGFQVLVSQGLNSCTILTCMTCYTIKAPCPAQVQSIQVYEFTISTIFHLGDGEEGDMLSEQSWQEFLYP